MLPLEHDKFLAARRESLMVAQRRVFLGSEEPIPEVPRFPGIWEPRATTVLPSPQYVPETSARPGSHGDRRKAAGNLQIGQLVPTYFGVGHILAYIDRDVDPMPLLPPGTPVWQLSGCRPHGPSNIPRYLVQTIRQKHPWFLFTKCLTLEKAAEKGLR